MASTSYHGLEAVLNMTAKTVQRSIGILPFVGVLGGLVTCQSSRTLSVRELERIDKGKPQIVTVRGCYHNFLERSVLLPCDDPKPNEVFRVLFRSQLEEMHKYVPTYETGSNAYERPSPAEKELELELDALANGVLAEVVLRGEVTRAPQELSAEHEPEFVVHRVVRIARRK